MRAGRDSRGPASGWRRIAAALFALASAATFAAAPHAHADHGDHAPAYVQAPVGAPCSGALAHEGGAAPAGTHCRVCQELSQARAGLPSSSAAPRATSARVARTDAQIARVAQRVAAAHPSRAPPRG